MSRVSLKIVGASGQGLNSIGEVVAKGLKRGGYCIFGYREYPSLIKGGHASYQLDVSDRRIRSTEERVNILVALNHHGLELNLGDLKEGGIIVHVTPGWQFGPEDEVLVRKRKITVIHFPVEEFLRRLQAKPILANVLLTAFLWRALGQDEAQLKTLVAEKFAKKKNLLPLNMQCIEEGCAYVDPKAGLVRVDLPLLRQEWRDHLLLTGSQAMGLGAVHAGVRLYAGYPMTPSSPLLSTIADLQNRTGMVIKQAEDEITASQFVSGAMFMGTRALTATSGGGFDLMSETFSMNGMIENPVVFVLAQRPGPSTGLPTWTAQGDLLLAANTAHGEFARCVVAVSDSQDAFDLMPEAFNLAEEFQTPVIVLTDKQIAEALYTQSPYDQSRATVRRGKLVSDPAKLAKRRASDRYDPSADDGVSPRWFPGSRAETYCAQADEHTADGTVEESAQGAKAQMNKRMRKMETLKERLPEPELWVEARRSSENPELDLLLIGWGSTKGMVLDVLETLEKEDPTSPRLHGTRRKGRKGRKVAFLHYTYLWPLKTERLEKLARKAKKVVLVEQNYQGQLGMLIRQQCGLQIADRILKYDGRPFFYNELRTLIEKRINEGTKKRNSVRVRSS